MDDYKEALRVYSYLSNETPNNYEYLLKCASCYAKLNDKDNKRNITKVVNKFFFMLLVSIFYFIHKKINL